MTKAQKRLLDYINKTMTDTPQKVNVNSETSNVRSNVNQQESRQALST